MYLKNRIIIFFYFFISFCLLFFSSIFFISVYFVLFSLISFFFRWFRFISLISFRFRWFRFVSFLFRFALYRCPIVISTNDFRRQVLFIVDCLKTQTKDALMYFLHTVQKVISRWGSRVQQPFIDFKTQTNFLIFFFFSFYSMNLFLLHIVIILKEFSDLM